MGVPIEPSKVDALVAELVRQMDSGELPPGAKLPSDAEMSRMYDIGRGTIRIAMARLHDRIIFVPGRGRFVKE